MSLFMRYPDDQVHAQSPDAPGSTLCGLPLAGAKEVTEAQVVIHKANERCRTCLHIRRAQGDAA